MGLTFWSVWTQFFPPKPQFTEASVPDLDGKVYIVTGSNTGVGKELVRMLYSKNARVYMAARTESKALAAISDIKSAVPQSKGIISYLHLDLADLSTIKPTVTEFLSREKNLHVLFNNAGVMSIQKTDAVTAQGHEIHIGTNNIGTQLLTKLLTPTLAATAASSSPPSEDSGSVRVVWVASHGSELTYESPHGVPLDDLQTLTDKKKRDQMTKYGLSKVGNYLQAAEYGRRLESQDEKKILSVAVNPGNLMSDLYREHGSLVSRLIGLIAHEPYKGAYTELYAGLSPELSNGGLRDGEWVIPFGRKIPTMDNLVKAGKPESQGGTGGGEKFWDWIEKQVEPYS